MKYIVHPSSIVEENCQIGEGTKIWHFCHILPGAIIGNNCSLGQNVVVMHDVVLGNNVKVQNNVSIYTGVVCEDDVFLGPCVAFTNVINPRSAVNRRAEFKTTFVRTGASIGANATIICGITIGKYAMIGAGSVVTKNVPDYALVYGNPARQHGWVSAYGIKLDFEKDYIAVCKESKKKYILNNGKVEELI